LPRNTGNVTKKRGTLSEPRQREGEPSSYSDATFSKKRSGEKSVRKKKNVDTWEKEERASSHQRSYGCGKCYGSGGFGKGHD